MKGLARKIAAIETALKVNKPNPQDPIDVLSKVGGYEIAGLAGAILGAASTRTPVICDGLIATGGRSDRLPVIPRQCGLSFPVSPERRTRSHRNVRHNRNAAHTESGHAFRGRHRRSSGYEHSRGGGQNHGRVQNIRGSRGCRQRTLDGSGGRKKAPRERPPRLIDTNSGTPYALRVLRILRGAKAEHCGF